MKIFTKRTDEIEVGKNSNIINPEFLQMISTFCTSLLWTNHLDNTVCKKHIPIRIWNVIFGNENIEKKIESDLFFKSFSTNYLTVRIKKLFVG